MLELKFPPLGPGSPRSGSGVFSSIGAEHPYPKKLEMPTLLLPPLLPLPKPLAPSPCGCNRRPPGPPGIARADRADSGWEVEEKLPLLIMRTIGREHGPSSNREHFLSSCF